MLRNIIAADFVGVIPNFLNEVLSLNAQEYFSTSQGNGTFQILNEVLSLNAQELGVQSALHVNLTILNEVLSLNAQESYSVGLLNIPIVSSMKS